MDVVTVLVLLGFGFVLFGKRFLPFLKNKQAKKTPVPKDGTSIDPVAVPCYRILTFCANDFSFADDLGNCVEYELGKTFLDLSKDSYHLMGDPFPVVVGDVLLIFLCYTKDVGQAEEVAG